MDILDVKTSPRDLKTFPEYKNTYHIYQAYILNQFNFNIDTIKLTARNIESGEHVLTEYNDIYMLEPTDTEFDNYQIIENMANMAVPAENMYSIVKYIYRKEQSVGKELDENEIVIICAEIYEDDNITNTSVMLKKGNSVFTSKLKTTTPLKQSIIPFELKPNRDTKRNGVDYYLSMFVKMDNSEEQNNKIKSLVKFWTNNDYVPIAQALNIQFKPDSDDLPNSHTCFNTIDLPAYQTYEKFESKMDQSISSIMYDIGIQDGGKYRYLNKKHSKKEYLKRKIKTK